MNNNNQFEVFGAVIKALKSLIEKKTDVTSTKFDNNVQPNVIISTPKFMFGIGLNFIFDSNSFCLEWNQTIDKSRAIN